MIAILLIVSVLLMPAGVFGNDVDDEMTHEESQQERTWRANMLSERTLSRRQDGLDIRNPIPDMTSAFGDGYALINEQISEAVTQIISEASRVRARSVSFSFDNYVAGDVISIVIYADVSATPQRMLVRSVNFSLATGQILSMNEAMGMDIIPLTERVLRERILSDPARYMAAMYTSLEGQAFYMTSTELVILFDGLRLSAQYRGIDSIRLIRRNIHTTTIARNDYRVHTNGYRLMFIPVGSVVRALGYDVGWNGEDDDRHVYIERNGHRLIQLWPNENQYFIVGSQPRALESAPRIYDDRTYVPITFFDHILPLTSYSISSGGSITFLAYHE